MATPSDRFRRPAPQPRRAEGLSARGFLLAALLTGAFGVGAVVAGYLWMAKPGVSDAVLSATGRVEPTAAPQPLDDGTWTDADIRDCKAEATAAADAAKKRRLTAVSTDRVGLGGPDAAIVERSTYLLCGATRKPLHLCKRYWRSWFIKAIREHADDFRQVSSSAYWTKMNVAERARRDAGNAGQWQAITDSLDQTTREVAQLHDDITVAFRARIEDGIINPDAFGKFLGLGIPSHIGAMIGDARPIRDVCG